jgi:tetratricopeptide (TPR) repeat protein
VSSQLPEPERWVDRPARHESDSASAESAVGTAFRRVKEATEPSDEAADALARRLREPHHRARPAALVWRIAAATAVLISMCGAVGAARLIRRWRGLRAQVEVPSAAPAPRPQHTRVARVVAAANEAPLVAAPAAVAVEGAPATRVATRSVVASRAESDLLVDAFRELRTQGDPSAALRVLDDYDRRFPSGVLRSEARTARAEALMVQDRRQEAFPLLLDIAEGDPALTRDVRVTRGELLAENGRCVEAVRDFERALVVADDDTLGGRALYGRASCRLRAGEVPAARVDLQRYLALQPDGASAPAARRALESMP